MKGPIHQFVPGAGRIRQVSTFFYPMSGEISQGGGSFSKKEKTEEDLYFKKKVLSYAIS